MRILPIVVMLGAVSVAAQAPRALTGEDKAQIPSLVTGYAKALGSCAASHHADLFAPDKGYFAGGFSRPGSGSMTARIRRLA